MHEDPRTNSYKGSIMSFVSQAVEPGVEPAQCAGSFPLSSNKTLLYPEVRPAPKARHKIYSLYRDDNR